MRIWERRYGRPEAVRLPSGHRRYTDAQVTWLRRVAEALQDTKGPIIIAGHSDASPIKSARFKSNMELSLARAETVRKTIAGLFDDPSRLQS